jgi:phage terminase large subunit-like protein
VSVLKAILKNPSSVITHAPTEANRAYLAESFLAEVQARYGGTRFGRQELDGVLVEEADGALWTNEMLEAARDIAVPPVNRIVVAVDPPVTANKSSDECGIVVVGADTRGEPKDWRAVVLEDASVKGATPEGWARAALAAMERHGADRLVAEVNQGGDLVEQLVRMVDPLVPYRGVHATRSKWLRAEPVAALYEQGRVAHVRGLGALEDQMCRMAVTGWQGSGSPDRLDALVWALTDLMLVPLHGLRPSVRSL